MAFLRLALNTLRRDLRAGELNLLLVALVLAVASLTSVAFLTDRVGRALDRDANQLLGGDMLLVADQERILLLSGNGEVIEPDGSVAAIGSGGFYALAAGRALVGHSQLSAAEIAREALTIAADICVYTNHNIKVEELEDEGGASV